MSNSEGLPLEQGHLDDSNNNTDLRVRHINCFCYQEKLVVNCMRSTISYYIARLITLVIWWRRRRSRRSFRRGWRPPWSPLTSDPHRSWTMLWPRAHSALLKVRAMTWNIKKTRWISGYFGPNIKYNLAWLLILGYLQQNLLIMPEFRKERCFSSIQGGIIFHFKKQLDRNLDSEQYLNLFKISGVKCIRVEPKLDKRQDLMCVYSWYFSVWWKLS